MIALETGLSLLASILKIWETKEKRKYINEYEDLKGILNNERDKPAYMRNMDAYDRALRRLHGLSKQITLDIGGSNPTDQP